MRISDWSSDVCSSDLAAAKAVAVASRQAARDGFAWNADQRTATEQLLTSRNRITAVQGYAGTAKTTTVPATFAWGAEARGVSVVAFAQTASAAMVLGYMKTCVTGKGFTSRVDPRGRVLFKTKNKTYIMLI